MATQTSLSLARQIKEDLTLVSTGFTPADSFDAAGNPVITLGGTANSKGCSIRVVPVETVQVNSIGLAQTVFCPEVIQLVVEAADEGADVYPWMTMENMAKILPLLTKHNVRVDVFMSDYGVAPDFAKISAAGACADTNVAKIFTIDNLWHPLTASM